MKTNVQKAKKLHFIHMNGIRTFMQCIRIRIPLHHTTPYHTIPQAHTSIFDGIAHVHLNTVFIQFLSWI